MYGYLTNELRHLSTKEYNTLKEMCHYSNELYNHAIRYINLHKEVTGKLPTLPNLSKAMFTDPNYHLLESHQANHVLLQICRAYSTFFAKLKNKIKNGSTDQINPPAVRDDDFNLLINPIDCTVEKSSYFNIPMGAVYRTTHDKIKIHIPYPEILIGKRVKQVAIIPRKGRFYIHYTYLKDGENLGLDTDNTAAVDFGVDNLMTVVTNTGDSIIIDGKALKYINYKYLKRKKELQSLASRQHMDMTKEMERLATDRDNKIKDYLLKSARKLIDFCIDHNAGTIVIGWSKGFKDMKGVKHKGTKNSLGLIPFTILRRQLKYLCEHYSMQYMEQEESYTSQASFLDQDDVPSYYDPHPAHAYKFSGERISRGQYRTKDGTIINADVNGAANTLVKSGQPYDFEVMKAGILHLAPHRIRIE